MLRWNEEEGFIYETNNNFWQGIDKELDIDIFDDNITLYNVAVWCEDGELFTEVENFILYSEAYDYAEFMENEGFVCDIDYHY